VTVVNIEHNLKIINFLSSPTNKNLGFAQPVSQHNPISPTKKQLSPDIVNPALPITEVSNNLHKIILSTIKARFIGYK
jgi:hypothetical protein